MHWFPILICSILLDVSAPQADGSRAVYLIENVPTQGLVLARNLVRLSSDGKGRLVSEVLLTQDQRFFGHDGGHRLVQERFVVTNFGAVIDIRSKKVIHDEQYGRLLGLDGEKVIYRVDNANRPNGIFAFDLKERKVSRVAKEGSWGLPGVKSPDQTMSVESTFDALMLHQVGQAPKELGKGFHVSYSPLSSTFGPSVPLWLDGQRLLAVQANNKLAVMTTQGVVEQVIEVKGAPAAVVSTPTLWVDKQKRVIYSCGGGYFLANVENKTTSPLERIALGHGFEASVDTDQQRRHTIYHEGKAIGQWACNPWREAEAAPGLLAFAYEPPGANAFLSQPSGVAVWDARVGDWRVHKMWVNDLIGWSK